MQFLLTTRVVCNWKRSLFISDALMERIFTSLIKFEYFFKKKVELHKHEDHSIGPPLGPIIQSMKKWRCGMRR